jgi:predicted AlkP superfamily pyrophosphatase or phosphodiesterase
MRRTAILNVVGLTDRLIGAHTPALSQFKARNASSVIEPAFPAVTCSAQSTYLTGLPPSGHGIVANGWYDRALAEVHFWKQSNRLVAGEKLWESLRRRHPGFTCAKLFWWHNMYSTADYSITPRPMYPADGRKIFDIYSWPPSLRPEVKRALGEFPFPTFWGPAAGRQTPQGPPDAASRWIAGSARWVEEHHQPSLSLIYLPHLDYNLQRRGVADAAGNLRPEIESDLRAIDAIVGDLIQFFEGRGVQVVILSEYGLVDVNRPIHLNRVLRREGWITLKEELGLELLDAGNSQAFAVADHQVAHIYVKDPKLTPRVREVVRATEGVAEVLGPDEKRERGIDHPRAGDLIAVSREDAWFTYYYWLDDSKAPDFARCVDIHRKPGYDPVELFTDPSLSPLQLKAKIAWRLLKKKLGFRMLMDVIPLDANLVRGSHGARPSNQADWPILIAKEGLPTSPVRAVDVRDRLLDIVG